MRLRAQQYPFVFSSTAPGTTVGSRPGIHPAVKRSPTWAITADRTEIVYIS